MDGTAEGAALWTFDLHMDKMFLPQSTSLEHLKRVHAALGRHIEAAEAACDNGQMRDTAELDNGIDPLDL